MIIKLLRYSYAKTETEGRLIVGDKVFATIEQPWTENPNGAKGGKPFESCIPDGMYYLESFMRPSGESAFIIFNPELGVFRFPKDHIKGHGRNLCLIHAANWVTDIQGCIAPGMARYPMVNPKTRRIAQAVRSSGAAMESLRSRLGWGEPHHILSITSEIGASDA
jgi:hypothetical protein